MKKIMMVFILFALVSGCNGESAKDLENKDESQINQQITETKNVKVLNEQHSQYFDQIPQNVRTSETYERCLISYDELIEKLEEYDNGFTDDDYESAEGEVCLHHRGDFETDNIRAVIISDPHRLFSYFVVVADIENNKSDKIYFDELTYESVKNQLFEAGFVRTDYSE